MVNALVRNLEGLGYKVVSAVSTGEEAIARVKETLPDLVMSQLSRHISASSSELTMIKFSTAFSAQQASQNQRCWVFGDRI